MFKTTQSIEDRYLTIIDELINAGYGWKKYAENIKAQGWISNKQKETLILMHQKVSTRRETYQSHSPRPSRSESRKESYGREWYDEEESAWHGKTEWQGSVIDTTWHDDGRTTYNWGGPCAPTTYNEYGEEC